MKNAVFAILLAALFPFVTNAEVACPQGQADNGSGVCVDEAKAIEGVLKGMVRPPPTSTTEGFARVREIEAALGRPEAFYGAKSILRAQLLDLQGQLGIYVKVLSEHGNVFLTTEKDGKLQWKWMGVSLNYDKNEVDYAKRCSSDGKICAGQFIMSKSGYVYKVSGAFIHGLLLGFDEFINYDSVAKVSVPCPEANTWMHSKKIKPLPQLIAHYKDPKAGFYTEGGTTYIRGAARIEACFADGTYAITRTVQEPLGGFRLNLVVANPKDYIPYSSYNTENPSTVRTEPSQESYDSAAAAY